MINDDRDPLRFLKPRKKQFHLTPTKHQNKKQSQKLALSTLNPDFQYSFLNNEIMKPISKQKILIKNNQSISQVEQISSTYQYSNNENKHKQKQKNYNPLKYFSKEVQQFLKNKNGINSLKNKNQITQNNIFKNKNQILNSKILNQQFIIPLQKNGDFMFDPTQNTVRLQDYFQQSQRPSKKQKTINVNQKNRNNKHLQMEFIEQIKKNVSEVNRKVQNLTSNYSQTDSFYQDNNNKKQQNLLKPCLICGRKFNPNSYQKHAKVCQKVFFKKRKQFSSQKQRSHSKDRTQSKDKKK